MFFIRDAYANIWSVKPAEKRTMFRASTSEKMQDGSRKYSSWNGVAFGKAKEKMADVERILASGNNKFVPVKILTGKLENCEFGEPDENGKKKYYMSLVIIDFEISDSVKTDPAEKPAITESEPKDNAKEGGDPDDDLPF